MIQKAHQDFSPAPASILLGGGCAERQVGQGPALGNRELALLLSPLFSWILLFLVFHVESVSL